jgi:hypothetical protein
MTKLRDFFVAAPANTYTSKTTKPYRKYILSRSGEFCAFIRPAVSNGVFKICGFPAPLNFLRRFKS